MKIRKKMLACIMLLICVVSIALCKIDIMSDSSKDYIDQLIDKYKPVGACVAVIEKGEITDIRNYGYADLENKIPVKNDTEFKIASISKTVTSYAVMQLVDEGKLDLDEPVNTYLKEWKVPESDFDENKVTLRTLMSHTSGITGSDEIGYSYPLPDIYDSLKDRDIKLKREPGTVFEYSEFAGLGICQLVIQDVTGEKFEDYMENHIFKKLNMKNTNYENKSSNGLFAVPYAGINKAVEVTPIVMNGGGGVTSTGNDMASFAIQLMNYYNNGNKEMFKAQRNTENTGGKYALGIIPRELNNGKKVYEHNGTLTGWNAQLAIEPESGSGIVILTNSDKAFYLTYALMEKWGEKVLGEKVVDTQIKQIKDIFSIATFILTSIVLFLICILVIKIKKGKIILKERKIRNRRYIMWSSIFLILGSIYILFIYTDIPFDILFHMKNYFMFTFFPPIFKMINVLLFVFMLYIICRSGYEKKL